MFSFYLGNVVPPEFQAQSLPILTKQLSKSVKAHTGTKPRLAGVKNITQQKKNLKANFATVEKIE